MASTTASKVRCPACGAKNDAASAKCRICAQDLRGEVEQPLSQPTPGSTEMKSARLSGVFLAAVGGVLLVALLALLFGVVSGPKWLSDVRNKVPFLSQQADDGWTAFTEPDARWSAELPVDRTQTTVPLVLAPSGTAPAWVAGLGGTSTVPDTELTVAWTTVPAPEGDNVAAALASAAEQLGTQLGGRVERNDEASFAGLPARRVTITRLRQGGEVASVEALLVLRRDQLVLLESRSVYADHPQFSRLVSGFSFL
jgi:hypothetical protein